MPSEPSDVLVQTEMPGVQLHARGKVRDVYLVDRSLLLVATDRISAFDYILQSGIPNKGAVLTQLSLFWFDFLKETVPNHVITADVERYPANVQRYRSQLLRRSMLVQRAVMVDFECVARGYLSGSGWKEYQATGSVCGVSLPPGLQESSRLPEPIFTPATKADGGHDQNVPFEYVVSHIGRETAEKLRELTLTIYSRAAQYAETKGIIIADTKFEFGWVNGALTLADEVLTPDSSRFWPAEEYRPGGPQPSFDKQFVRDYLESVPWDKQPPAPALPAEVVARTSDKYQQAYQLLSGRSL